jgi:hypothetical protein
VRTLVVLALLARVASADNEEPEPVTPCEDSIIDPIVTPVRDGQLDAQRGACLRSEYHGGLRLHALVDTPGFHGVLGGDLELGRKLIVAKAHELSASLTLMNYTFVQNAVNKSSQVGFGPLMLGGAAGGALGPHGQGAVALRLELPLTHHHSDTVRTSAQLLGLVSGALSHRTVIHARLGPIYRFTSSDGGETHRLAFVGGADLVWHLRQRLALQAGIEAMAGWNVGFDHLLVRAGLQWRLESSGWRVRAGAAVPVAANERTTPNAILDLTLVVDR